MIVGWAKAPRAVPTAEPADSAVGTLRFADPTKLLSAHSSFLVHPHRCLELVAELVEFVRADVADGPKVQAALAPAANVEALDRVGPGGASFGRRGLRHEQIDDVLAAAIHDGADRARIDI